MVVKQSDFIWFNGNIITWSEAKVHVMAHSLHYGSSVFEGIRCYRSIKGPVLFRHRDHVQRLINSAKIYRMLITIEFNDLMQANRHVVCKNNLVNGCYVRPIIFIGDINMDICPSKNYVADIAIAAFSWKSCFEENYMHQGINVMVSSWNRVAANTIPNTAKAGGNYLSSILISEEARRYGYQEGIALDIFGYVSEGSGGNLFAIKDGVLFTPPVTSSILPGITRDTVIKLAKYAGFEVKEQILTRESLYLSDEIFISGTAIEIVPVCSVDGIKIGNGSCGLITKKIQKLFFGLFTGDTEDIWGWLNEM